MIFFLLFNGKILNPVIYGQTNIFRSHAILKLIDFFLRSLSLPVLSIFALPPFFGLAPSVGPSPLALGRFNAPSFLPPIGSLFLLWLRFVIFIRSRPPFHFVRSLSLACMPHCRSHSLLCLVAARSFALSSLAPIRTFAVSFLALPLCFSVCSPARSDFVFAF